MFRLRCRTAVMLLLLGISSHEGTEGHGALLRASVFLRGSEGLTPDVAFGQPCVHR